MKAKKIKSSEYNRISKQLKTNSMDGSKLVRSPKFFSKLVIEIPKLDLSKLEEKNNENGRKSITTSNTRGARASVTKYH